MDELEFRASLRDALDHTTAPPSMPPGGALQAGRRAARRRTLATGAAGAGVLAIVTALGLVVATAGSGAQQAAGPGAPSPVPLASGNGPSANGTPSPVPIGIGGETKPVWPTGVDGSPQGDRTARAGRKADAAKALAAHVISLVPAGYTAVPDAPMNIVQAQFEDKVGGQDRWSYLVTLEIRKGATAGQLIVEVYEPGLRPGAGLCDLIFWSAPGTCTTVQSGGQTVALSTGSKTDDRLDKWSTYRYPDGTTVYVAQSRQGNFTPENTAPPLTDLPFDDQRLAALALDQAFHIVA
ncbi:hypothetical protein ABT369_44915 [Dactylosporangium sp. NPDC000244]|uniref:hypothetical protein n=1 Tax=Dactylosporangium sp. NPDC000244 TaxID=3154365 RepID=UPI00332325B3